LVAIHRPPFALSLTLAKVYSASACYKGTKG
jgi:hypothetical protein